MYMKHKESAEVIFRKKDGPYTWLKLKSPLTAAACQPGQFINVRTSDSLDPLLRRPFSIAFKEMENIELLYHTVGKGTASLDRCQPGDKLSILGPLGNPFPQPGPGRKPLFVAGGIGIAPFLFFSQELKGAVLLYGARDKSLIPSLIRFEENISCIVATDNGSQGQQGNVLTLLKQYDLTEYEVYACGPTAMFRAMSQYFQSQSAVRAWYSLETYMGCGFGACKGCSVPVPDSDEMKLSCVDGPVFAWNEVVL